MKKLIALVLPIIMTPMTALAEWTPLIHAIDFDGIKVDLTTAAGGLITLCLVVLGVGLLVRQFR